MYGKELVLDMHGCDPSLMTRTHIEKYFIDLCKLIDMTRCELHWWDDEDVPEADQQTDPKLVGISAVQFIITSNATIHTLPLLKSVYVNLFSCKDFDDWAVEEFSQGHFSAAKITSTLINRTMADEVE